MRRSIHVAISFFSALLISNHLSLPLLPSLFSALGAWIPDLDLHFKHRMLLHNVFAATISALTLYLVYASLPYTPAPAPLVATFYLLGYIEHILCDITYAGVAPLYPLSKKRIRSKLTNREANVVGFAVVLLMLYLYLRPLLPPPP